MDDNSFKTDLLAKLDRIQSLLTYLCGAAKAAEERAKAAAAITPSPQESPTHLTTPVVLEQRSLLQEEMQDDYQQAIQKWKQGKGS
jgi:hypothetical protein